MMKVDGIVKTTLIATTIAIMFMCGFSNGGDDKDTIKSKYHNVTQNYHRNTVATTIDTVNKTQENESNANDSNNNGQPDPNTPGVGNVPPVDTSSWLATLDSVHKQFGAAGFVYDLGGHRTLTREDGSTVTVRIDCSGYIGYCLYCKGWASVPEPITSGSDLTPFGFALVHEGPVSLSDLAPGDVLEWSGHIQAYAGPGDDWYNWGGHSSAEGKYAGVTDVSTVDSQSHSCNRLGTVLKVYRPTQQ